MLYLKLIITLKYRGMNSYYNEGGSCYHVKIKEDKNMNNSIIEALWKDYNDLGDILKVIDNGDDRRNGILEERDKIRNEILKYEQSKNEIEIKREEIIAENRREKNRNRVTYATSIATFTLSLYAIWRTFKFDEDSTMTSTLGRGIMNVFIPKLGKKQ